MLRRLKAVEERSEEYMKDWIAELDDFATRYGKGVLPGPSSVSHEAAIEQASAEYDEYLKRLADELSPAEQDYLTTIKATQKQLERTAERPNESVS